MVKKQFLKMKKAIELFTLLERLEELDSEDDNNPEILETIDEIEAKRAEIDPLLPKPRR